MMYFLFFALLVCILTEQICNFGFVAIVVLFMYNAIKQLYKFTKND